LYHHFGPNALTTRHLAYCVWYNERISLWRPLYCHLYCDRNLISTLASLTWMKMGIQWTPGYTESNGRSGCSVWDCKRGTSSCKYLDWSESPMPVWIDSCRAATVPLSWGERPPTGRLCL
jgi:hypothetical protein